MARTTTKMGLTSWNEGEDNYSYEQLANNWQLIDFHDHTPGRGVPVAPGGLAPGAVLQQNIAAGVVGVQHLSTQLTKDLGMGSAGRGSVQVGASTTVTTTSMTIPDQVMNLQVDAGALVGISYQALWKVSSGGTAFGGITANGNLLPISVNNGAPVGGYSVSTVNTFLETVVTSGFGLINGNSNSANSSEVNTGQIVGFIGGSTTANSGGGETFIFFNTAGTYSIGIGYWVGATGNTATIQNRHLWVRTINFE